MPQIDKLIYQWEKFYYGDILLMLVELVALTVGLIYARKNRIGKFFICYILFDFILLITDQYLASLTNISYTVLNKFINITNPIISLVELSAYYYFFYKTLSGRKIKSLLKVLFAIFLILLIIFLTTKFSFISPRLKYIAYLVTVIEFTFILPPCFVYFYQLMTTISDIKLFKRPSFWIVTGIFFFSIISIPHYLLGPYLFANNPKIANILIATFFYVPFALNFVFLTKAFLCKKTLTI